MAGHGSTSLAKFLRFIVPSHFGIMSRNLSICQSELICKDNGNFQIGFKTLFTDTSRLEHITG